MSIALKQAKNEPFKSYVAYKNQKIDDSFIKFNSYLYDAIYKQKEAS
ncbi:hypothetical protein MNB_SM-7-209 [hydrothermal vent metagenome]|uniref:Uncharacterized protein n=1 Tax=hydrothermal vent metagenome TaxID=652676 RepID=A0A1W1B918_9ZZZZ